jgi:hypothetical protein
MGEKSLPATHIYSEYLNTKRTNNPTNEWANKLGSSQKKYKCRINT